MKVIDGVLTDVEDKDIINGTFVFLEDITSIGEYVFYSCTSWTTITLSEENQRSSEPRINDASHYLSKRKTVSIKRRIY